MARDPGSVTPELQHEVEQFYYREARLLDGREYQTWLGLCTEDIRYVMPGRGNPLVDNAERGQEGMISIERELEGIESDGLPMRDERHIHLFMRVDRATKPNAWAENPPARTRRTGNSPRPPCETYLSTCRYSSQAFPPPVARPLPSSRRPWPPVPL